MKLRLLAPALAVLLLDVAFCQEIRLDLSADAQSGPGYSPSWDGVQDRLVLRREIKVETAPAVKILSSDNSLAIYPMKDLPESRAVFVWSAAATAEGGAVVDVIAEYGISGRKPEVVRSFLMTYDASGTLTKLWDVSPYHHKHVVVDRDGNVFGFGVKDGTDFPLLVKYSPNGDVLREFLPSAAFADRDRVVFSTENGESKLFIAGDYLFLWVPATQELLRFSLSGEIVGRLSLELVLTQLAQENGAAAVRVMNLGSNGADLFAQLQFWPAANTDGQLKYGLAKFAAANPVRISLLAPLASTPAPGRFIGVARTGKLVFVELAGNAVVIRQH